MAGAGRGHGRIDPLVAVGLVELGRELAGMGLIRTNGEFADDPFYAFRVGLNLELLPRVNVDISANYRFNDSVQLEDDDTDIDADTIFLGAAIRFAL